MSRTRLTWFGHGLMAGVLIVAALNAGSYFVRSGRWGELLSKHNHAHSSNEALGFPVEIWRDDEFYGGAFVDYWFLTVNALTALAFGGVLGTIAVARCDWLNRFVDDLTEADPRTWTRTLQFSLRGMLLMTTVAAVVAGAARSAIGARPELLAGVYILGPLFLVGVAMIPRSMPWELRVVLLIPSTILLVWFAAMVGSRLGIRFDRVMMAIFICWVPQSVGAAVLLVVGMAVQFGRKRL